ncbi:MAG: hypothetical protein GX158_09320 [Bacteroidales bacterium]|nr:hypothetical protein [Bacteroidales bacterium]
MDFNATIDLIIRELDEAAKIIEDVRNYREVPVMQLELVRAKCRNAADVIRLLKDMPEKTYLRKQTKASDTFPEKTDSSKHAATASDTFPEKTDTGPRTTQAGAEERKSRAGEPEKAETETLPSEPARMSADKITIADSFSPRTDSVIEKLGTRKEEDDMRSRIKSKPIHSLTEAIGINDKFLFVRELFQGDTGKYNKAVSALENSSGFEEARKMIMDYAGNDKDNEAAKQLIELVKRKFSADE